MAREEQLCEYCCSKHLFTGHSSSSIQCRRRGYERKQTVARRASLVNTEPRRLTTLTTSWSNNAAYSRRRHLAFRSLFALRYHHTFRLESQFLFLWMNFVYDYSFTKILSSLSRRCLENVCFYTVWLCLNLSTFHGFIIVVLFNEITLFCYANGSFLFFSTKFQ